jgi:exodeoxyribonuclease-3
MRLVTWNIRNGGGDRRDAILEVLRRERPDVLALQELRGHDRQMAGVADALGMVPHLAPSVFGQPVAVLVRPPLRRTGQSTVTWRLHHAAAAVTVGTPAGPLTVVSTHLNPIAPYRRMREAIWLGARFGSRRRMVLLAGDLNGLDPHGDHAAALASLDPRYRRRHLAPDGTVDTRAVAAFERAGLRDLWPAGGVGDGRTVPTTGCGGAEFGAMRLDYLLGTPAVAGRVRELRVLRGDETEHASDHYPVRAELDFTAATAASRSE